jgi:protein-S-isoprenylcysteine O-methyltransferase Ste14
MDSAPDTQFWWALIVDSALLGIFALQHSVMARPAFKARCTRIVPEPAERSTYVLFSSLALILLFGSGTPGEWYGIYRPHRARSPVCLFAFGWLRTCHHVSHQSFRPVWPRGYTADRIRRQRPTMR